MVLSAVVAQRSRMTDALQQALRYLAEQAIRDPMTGLHNRRFLREFLARELIRARRGGIGLAVIMMDLDHFKRINDTFGHDAGDLVLTEVAAMLKKSIRASDMVCRFGGEEFVLVLTDATRASASRRCEELRAAIRELEPTYRGRGLGKPTASFGVALFPDHAADADLLINASDEALYEAKYAGRRSHRLQQDGSGRRRAALTIRLAASESTRSYFPFDHHREKPLDAFCPARPLPCDARAPLARDPVDPHARPRERRRCIGPDLGDRRARRTASRASRCHRCRGSTG